MSENTTEPIFELLRQSHEGVLATLEAEGPFNSAVSFLYRNSPEGKSKPGKIFILMSALARHTKNIQKNEDVSLLVIHSGKDFIYERPRVSIQGKLAKIPKDGLFESLKEEYLKKFPKAKIFFSLPDFDFYELRCNEFYYVGGFGKVQVIK